MKKQIALLSLMVLFTFRLVAQVPDTTVKTANSEAQNAFFEKHGIQLTSTGMNSLVFNDAILYPEPNLTGTGLPLSKNEHVTAFKYFPDHKCWAVKYKDQFGFLPVDMVMPVVDNSSQKQEFDEAPKLKTKISPEVPELKEEGTVIVKCYIAPSGLVTDTEVIKSIPYLDKYAVDAIKKAKFSPAKLKGKSVGVWMNINVNFKY